MHGAKLADAAQRFFQPGGIQILADPKTFIREIYVFQAHFAGNGDYKAAISPLEPLRLNPVTTASSIQGTVWLAL